MKTISVSPELRKVVEDKVLECLLVLQSKLNRTDLPIPPVCFRQMGCRAGVARYTHDEDRCFDFSLWINPDYCQNGNLDHMIKITVPHEVAHIVSAFVHGRRFGRGHGMGWRSMMHLLGVPAERCHEMSMEGVKRRNVLRWFYDCGCQKHDVSTTIHSRIQAGRKYTCRRCKQPIRWTGVNSRNNLTPALNGVS